MLLSPRKKGLDSLFKEVRVFKVTAYRSLPGPLRPSSDIFFVLLGEGKGGAEAPGRGGGVSVFVENPKRGFFQEGRRTGRVSAGNMRRGG